MKNHRSQSRIVGEEAMVSQIGEARLTQLREIVEDSFVATCKDAKSYARPEKRLLANIMNTHIIERLERDFPGQVKNFKGRKLLACGPFLIQAKKLGDDGLPRNFPTKQALDFARQHELPGFPSLLRLTLGYREVSATAATVDVALLLQIGDQIAWSRDLLPPGIAQIQPLFATQTETKPAQLKAKIQAKQARKSAK